MKKKIELLRSVDLFSTLKDHELQVVARYSRYYRFQQGQLIFKPGAHEEELFIIKKGEVLITKPHTDVELARFITGECFGEMDLLDCAPRNAFARVSEDTTLLIFPMKGVAFRDVLQKHPEIFARILYKLLARIAGRIRSANALISEKVPWVQNVRKQLMRDKLTGLFNRTFLEEDFPTMLKDHGSNLSVVMIKPDRFKHINDTYGHDAGDRVLKYMSDTFTSMLRKDDIAVRVKGDEFALLLPDTTSDHALKIAEKVRRKMCILDLSAVIDCKGIPFPVSIGIATYPVHTQNPVSLTEIATRMMMSAYKSGGNTVLLPSE